MEKIEQNLISFKSTSILAILFIIIFISIDLDLIVFNNLFDLLFIKIKMSTNGNLKIIQDVFMENSFLDME